MGEEGKPAHAAEFSARLTAFCVDVALAVAGYFLTLKAVYPAFSPLMNPHGRVWMALWVGLFVVYQAFFSCEDRRTVGKALMGLKVVDGDGEPLELGTAVVRAAMYLPSSIFNLGFLWALFDKQGRDWADLATGSRVVSVVPASPARSMILRATACLCLAVLSGAWYWNNVLSVKRQRAADAGYSATGLSEIRLLQKRFFRKNGRYADSISDLASVSEEPKAFQEDARILFDDLRITASTSGYLIVGRATDAAKTPIAFTGP